jgi:Tfp pilus assembly protein PilF
MKRYEKWLLVFFAFTFGLQLLDFTGKHALITLTVWLLSLSYLIGGYWLFNAKNTTSGIIFSIIAGFSFSISLFFFPFSIWLNESYYYDYLPIVNGLFFIVLGIYLFLNRKSELDLQKYKAIFIRSLVILIITSFFSYTPVTFKPYRKVLSALNNGNVDLQNNLLMFDYSERCEDAIANGDCDKAIEFALKANSVGKIWLGIDPGGKEDKEMLLHISGTYTNLYDAYKCKADRDYDKNEFDAALKSYQIAHDYLTSCVHQSKFWDEEKYRSLTNIAFSYKRLNKYSLADSIYVKAIENYKVVKNKDDNVLAELFSNYALSLSEQLQFDNSNSLYETANSILRNDTLNKDNKRDLVSNYNNLTGNYLKQDKLKNALFCIHNTLKLTDNKKDISFGLTNLYYGVYFYKLSDYKNAGFIMETCLKFYKSQPGDNSHNIAECYYMLSQVNIALAKYDDARGFLNKAIEIRKNKFGLNSVRYASYLIGLADLNKMVGQYAISEKQYNTVIEIYSRELGIKNNRLPLVLSGLSNLETKLSKFNLAKEHSDSSLSIASNFDMLNYPSATDLLNEAAYVDYCLGLYNLAETLYREVIKVNKNYELKNNAASAVALNGLGLIETAKRNYLKADSLFMQSLKLHKSIFSDNHPLTAIVYLNLGNLYIQEGKLTEAQGKINKALQIDKQFFKDNHDIFADIYVALGDLSKKEGQNDIAKDYYKKALAIYLKKFDNRHWKVITTREKCS